MHKCHKIKANDTKRPLKVQEMDELITYEDAETKSISQIQVQFSDLQQAMSETMACRSWERGVSE